MSELLSFIRSFWDMFIGTIRSLVMAVEMVGSSLSFLKTFILYLPAAISAGVVIFLAVYLIRFLLFK